MSYSFDADGWELFNTPFGTTPVRTAPASPKQQAERPRQSPSEASQRNHSLTQEQKTSPLSYQAARVQQKPTAVQPPKPAPSATAPAVQNEKSAPSATAPAPVQADTTKQKPVTPPKAPVPASTQSVEPQKELVLDMSSGSGAAPAQDDTEKRKAHEAAEAKRRAEWEAKQAAKKQAEEAAIQKLQAMNDEDVIAASTARISTEVERLTRRNMKECVAEHIQELCRKDTEFARRTMHPRKSMVKCFRYINRMARDYVKQEMEDNDIKHDGGCYGCDVPDGIIYQFAEEFFNATDAPEDCEEEKFIPKPYVSTSAKPAKKAKKTEKKPKKQQNKPSNSYEQISLEGVI